MLKGLLQSATFAFILGYYLGVRDGKAGTNLIGGRE